MELTITIRKEVAEVLEAEHIYNLVKERLNDRADVTLSAHVSNHFPRKEATDNG